MGFYFVCFGDVNYVFISPIFDKVILCFNGKYYLKGFFVIEAKHRAPEDIYIKDISAGGKRLKGFTISHDELVNAETLKFSLTDGL